MTSKGKDKVSKRETFQHLIEVSSEETAGVLHFLIHHSKKRKNEEIAYPSKKSLHVTLLVLFFRLVQ
jgi:hypothetical protein